MLHPVGRLPSQVYWRRRLLLIAIVLSLSIATGWFFLGGASGDPGAATDAAAAESTAEEPAGEPALTGLEEIVPSLVPADPTDSTDPTDTTTPAAGATPAPAPEAAAPGPCPDAAIGLAVGAEFGTYAAGSKPLLGMSITNIGAVPCLRDLDVALQTWGLFAADGTRLWGSNDCYPDPSVPNAQLLAPGQVVAFTIIWSGKTSAPSCTAPRQILGPGSYLLRGYLGALFSPDALLVLT